MLRQSWARTNVPKGTFASCGTARGTFAHGDRTLAAATSYAYLDDWNFELLLSRNAKRPSGVEESEISEESHKPSMNHLDVVLG